MTRVPTTFKDHFSGHARDYADARPRYPGALFERLADMAPTRECAWDCATGNGQAALALAEHFDSVIASDASAEQIRSAVPHPRIDYRVQVAERPDIVPASLDLITVAQALHWFDISDFFRAAQDCLRPGGLLAYWCYGFCSIAPGCDETTRAMYAHVDRYWPAERTIVESGYRDITPPFAIVEVPPFEMQVDWSAEQMLAYIGTWSACQRYARATGDDPLARFRGRLRERWGPGQRTVRWPLHLTVCRHAP